MRTAAGVGGTDLHLTSIAWVSGCVGDGSALAVGVLVLLLAVPGMATAWMRVSNTDRPPVTTRRPQRRRWVRER